MAQNISIGYNKSAPQFWAKKGPQPLHCITQPGWGWLRYHREADARELSNWIIRPFRVRVAVSLFGHERILSKFAILIYQILSLISKLEYFDYTMEQSEKGYKNFTVIKCNIKSIEWLYLAAKGHRRAIFNFENKKNSWLVP